MLGWLKGSPLNVNCFDKIAKSYAGDGLTGMYHAVFATSLSYKA